MQEMGLRMALGATEAGIRARVVSRVPRQAARHLPVPRQMPQEKRRGALVAAPATPNTRLVAFAEVRPGFTRGRDVVSAGPLHDLLGAFYPVGIVAMDGNQNSAFCYESFIAFCLVFRNSHPYQGADEAADNTACAGASQRSHNRTGSDERSNTGNGECSNSRQQPEGAADGRAGAGSGGRPFRELWCASREQSLWCPCYRAAGRRCLHSGSRLKARRPPLARRAHDHDKCRKLPCSFLP